MQSRRNKVGLVTAAVVVVVASVLSPTWAWAVYSNRPTAETNIFQTHILLAPGQPACSGLGILTVTLTWAVTDSPYALGYELGESATSGGMYTFSTTVITGNSTNPSLSNGNQFFEVRAVNHGWIGPPSLPQEVTGVVVIVPVIATCP